MILISRYAIALQVFFNSLIDKARDEKFKIFVRPGFQLDVYMFVANSHRFSNIERRFDEFCKINFPDIDSIEKNDNIQIFFNVLSVSDLEDSFYSNVINNPNSIDYGSRYRFDSFYSASKYELKKNDQTKIPIITFYSHKGGVGRTTAMTSYALHLAKEGKTVAIIDCDLEAPGYLNFFDFSNHEELLNGEKNGLVEFLSDRQFLGENNVKIDNYMLNVGARNRSNNYQSSLDKIWLIPAGNLNEGVTENDYFNAPNRQAYLEGLAKLNLGNTQKVVEGFKAIFEQLGKKGVDAILIDSRTGFNDIFGTAALHLSSCVVGFFGLSRQNEPGFINLLEKHIENEHLFKLILAYSILPENYKENPSLKQAYDRMEYLIKKKYDGKEAPARQPIRRNVALERIGIGDNNAEENFIKMNVSTERNDQFSDYTQLFEKIDSTCFPEKAHLRIVNKNTAKEQNPFTLRNIVLQHLKTVLPDASNSAENVAFNPKTFFYRKCMGEFFKREKFVICGRKGTGKSNLYKALQNRTILDKIKGMSAEKDDGEIILIKALSTEKRNLSQHSANVRYIVERKFDFLNFWRNNVWARLLFLDNCGDELSKIRDIVVKKQEKIFNENYRISGDVLDVTAIDALEFLPQYVVDGLRTLNEELKKANKKVYILYDSLDAFIPPAYWDEAISSLIRYWNDSKEELGNIIPKIFIRTDLLSQIESLNTELTSDNIVNMEWSIEEVFGYFFKLVFSDSTAGEACWNFAESVNVDSQYISDIKEIFEENDYQYKNLSQSEMEPLLRVFFGEDTKKYGKPWDYFKKEVSNADHTMNLQAFINILNKNAVDKTLALAEPDVTEIVNPKIYTSADVRRFAADEVFRSYGIDLFNKDLIEFQYVVLCGSGGRYRYKSLNGIKFESLIDDVCKRLDIPNTGKHKARLINSIFANGIMTMEHTTRGNVFVFASLYWFVWELREPARPAKPPVKPAFPVKAFPAKPAEPAFPAKPAPPPRPPLNYSASHSLGLRIPFIAVSSAVNLATDIVKIVLKLEGK